MSAQTEPVLQDVHEEDLFEALSEIRPLLKGHAGDLTVDSVSEGVVTVQFHNACQSCPAISVTFAGLVRSRFMQVAGVKEVRSAQVHASAKALDRIAATLGAGRHFPRNPTAHERLLPVRALPSQVTSQHPRGSTDGCTNVDHS
jgi:Fe-S cluster biogenesis protein NfuA